MSRKIGSVAIVGLGYVGLPLALLADRKGYKVFGIDVNAKKVDAVNNRVSPFEDREIARQLKGTKMVATNDFSVLKDASTIVICVPTPVHHDHTPDLGPVEGACKAIAKHLKRGHLVILESTVNPGICESVVIPILEKASGLKAGDDFGVAHCPERINPGDKKWNVENIPRVVGGLDDKSLARAKAFYESILASKVKKMKSLKEAEAVKIVENSFRDINIAFANELAQSFSKLGIDVVSVIDGASTKPFAFLAHYPGCGVGGHCIPVDPYYLIQYAKQNGFRHRFLALARKINNEMPKFTVELVEKGLSERNIRLSGAKVAVLGLAYKKNIDDCRESPSFEIIKFLRKKGATIATYDPHVESESTAKTIEDALSGAQAVVVATDHREFVRRLTPRMLVKHSIGVLVDGRNCLKESSFVSSGILYKSIGR